ncbi:MAG: pilus assembly protein TadG-related protein [Pseudomonadota bacterium]
MYFTRPLPYGGPYCRRNKPGALLRLQRGQSLIYGIFMLIAGCVALFFLFNTGQLTQEKTKLVNTADAVAYSAGIMHARTLNYMAYTNRAMLANTVAISQLVSLSSWIQYADKLSTYGATSISALKYPAFYASYTSAIYAGPYTKNLLIDTQAIEKLAVTSDEIIRKELMGAQYAAYQGMVIARRQVMNEVAQANYRNDGSIEVDDLPLTGGDELQKFITRYEDKQRTRFAHVAQTAAHLDSFNKKRSWEMPSTPVGVCPGALATGRLDALRRRGGTNLISFDEWKAVDTLSEWKWVPKNKSDALCRGLSETPQGWGAQAANDTTTIDTELTHYDSSALVNPGATGLAQVISSSRWNYSGLPSFYDLSENQLKENDPRLQFAIRVRRKIDQTRTSEGQSSIKASKKLNQFHATPAGGKELVAVSASEVFFERPPTAHANQYGQANGKSEELGSLFNPYWQVRLIHSPTHVKQAQIMQGVVLP